MTEQATAPASQAAEVQVTLSKPHTHRGERLKAGAKIKVNATEKAWLEKRGIIGDEQEEVTHG